MIRCRNREEDAIQSDIAGLLEVAAIDGLIWFAVPNGGYRDWQTAKTLTATGVRPGVADLVLCHAALGTAFLEVKTPDSRSRQSKDQLGFEAECEAKGFAYAVARSRDEAQDILTRWGFLRVVGAHS